MRTFEKIVLTDTDEEMASIEKWHNEVVKRELAEAIWQVWEEGGGKLPNKG